MGLFEAWLRRRLEANENLVDRALLAADIEPPREFHQHSDNVGQMEIDLNFLIQQRRYLNTALDILDRIYALEAEKEEWRNNIPAHFQPQDDEDLDPDDLSWMDEHYRTPQARRILDLLNDGNDEDNPGGYGLAIAWTEWDRRFGQRVRQLKYQYNHVLHASRTRFPIVSHLEEQNETDIYNDPCGERRLRFRRASVRFPMHADARGLILMVQSHLRFAEQGVRRDIRRYKEKLEMDQLNYIHMACDEGDVQARKRKFDDESRRGGGGGTGSLVT